MLTKDLELTRLTLGRPLIHSGWREAVSSQIYIWSSLVVNSCVCVCVCVTVLWGWQPESRFIGASFRQLRETGVDLMFSLLTLSGAKEVVKVGAWVRCLRGSCFTFGFLRGSVMLSCPTGDISWTLLSSPCLRGCRGSRHCFTSVLSSAGEQGLVHTGG